MSALTIGAVATSDNEDSSAISCAHQDVGLTITSDHDVTLTPQVSLDGTNYFALPFGLSFDTPDVVPSAVLLAAGSYAFAFRNAGLFQNFRVNVANASGSTATVTLGVAVAPHARA